MSEIVSFLAIPCTPRLLLYRRRWARRRDGGHIAGKVEDADFTLEEWEEAKLVKRALTSRKDGAAIAVERGGGAVVR